MIVSDFCASFETVGIGNTLSTIKSNHHHIFIETYSLQRTNLLQEGARIAEPEFLTSKSFPTLLGAGAACDTCRKGQEQCNTSSFRACVQQPRGSNAHLSKLPGDTLVLPTLGLGFSNCKWESWLRKVSSATSILKLLRRIGVWATLPNNTTSSSETHCAACTSMFKL